METLLIKSSIKLGKTTLYLMFRALKKWATLFSFKRVYNHKKTIRQSREDLK